MDDSDTDGRIPPLQEPMPMNHAIKASVEG